MSQTVAVGDGRERHPDDSGGRARHRLLRQAEDSARRPRVHQRARPDQGAGLPALTSHDDSAKTTLSRFTTAPASGSVIIAPAGGPSRKKSRAICRRGRATARLGVVSLTSSPQRAPRYRQRAASESRAPRAQSAARMAFLPCALTSQQFQRCGACADPDILLASCERPRHHDPGTFGLVISAGCARSTCSVDSPSSSPSPSASSFGPCPGIRRARANLTVDRFHRRTEIDMRVVDADLLRHRVIAFRLFHGIGGTVLDGAQRVAQHQRSGFSQTGQQVAGGLMLADRRSDCTSSGPASIARVMRNTLVPVISSPDQMARCTGAAPRQCGSSEKCRLYQPQGSASSTDCFRIRPYAMTAAAVRR